MTDNHSYDEPTLGSTSGWGSQLNSNFRDLDTDVEIRDTDANKGNYTPKDGALYRATDTGAIYQGDGTSWVLVDVKVNSLSADKGDITKELVAKARLTSNKTNGGSSFAAGTWVVPADTEVKDNLNNQDSNFNINPDETGWYVIEAHVGIYDSTDTDRMEVAVRDVDAGSLVPDAHMGYRTSGMRGWGSPTFYTKLTAGTNYRVQLTNADSSFKVNGSNAKTGYTVWKVVVHP